MNDPLFDQLEAIHAYDVGAVDSGVHDEVPRRRLKEELFSLPEDELRLRLSRWVREAYLSDAGLESGYGWEDALEFLRWVDAGCSL